MKVINFYYKYDSPIDERIMKIKRAGFDGVFIHSKNTPGNTIEKILDAGLFIETLHLPYKKYSSSGALIDSRQVNSIWSGGIEAEEYISLLLAEVDLAHKYGIKTIVMHITGGDDPPQMNTHGLSLIEKVAKSCEKYSIILCMENLRRLDYLEYVFNSLRDYDLKFCFDSGHANVMTHNVSTFPWEKFGSRLYCLHLNDNDEKKDQHMPPLMGTINWENLMKQISFFNPNVNLTLEIRGTEELRRNLQEEEFLELAMKKLCDVARLGGFTI